MPSLRDRPESRLPSWRSNCSAALGRQRPQVQILSGTNRDIPATNNGSERALRPCAVFRKITNGFRTEWGAKLYADIRSVIEIARRRAIGVLEAIRLTLAGMPLPNPA